MEALEVAFKRGSGHITVYALPDGDGEPDLWRFSAGLHCPESHRRYSAPTPGMFSFNARRQGLAPPPAEALAASLAWTGAWSSRWEEDPTGGAVKPLQTPAWEDSQKDLIKYAGDAGVPTRYRLVATQPRAQAMGDRWRPGLEGNWTTQWYGLKRFFEYRRARLTRCTSGCCCRNTAVTHLPDV